MLRASVNDPPPSPDRAFDGVIAKDMLEHVTGAVAAITESLRLLRPVGTALASSSDAQRWVWKDYAHRRPFGRRAFLLLFRDWGFADVRAAYEHVKPGTSIASKRTHEHGRPRVRRNVSVVPRSPDQGLSASRWRTARPASTTQPPASP